MSYVYDPQRDLSDVVNLYAQDFAGEPIATIRLPVRVPHNLVDQSWLPGACNRQYLQLLSGTA